MKRHLGILAVILLFISCNVAKRQVTKMQLFAIKYPNDFKKLANDLAPCFAGGKIKSDTTIVHDTAELAGQIIYDTVRKKDTVKITKTVTINHIITNTKTIRDTIPDMRAIGACEANAKQNSDSLAVAKNLYSTASKKAEKRGWIMWGLIAAIGVYSAFKIYSFFSGGLFAGIAKKI